MKRSVTKIIPAAETTLPGEFVVRRALPRRELRRVGGFVFLDHFDENDVTPKMFDVPPHPHIGLQTVTYLFEGEALHRDSLDNECMISAGDVNWMTAGRGITHSEQVSATQRCMHGLQIWVGLPHAHRKTSPTFDHFPAADIPVINLDNVTIKVIAGEAFGQRSPIPTFQELFYLDVSANNGSKISIDVDPAHELCVYVCEGTVNIGSDIERFDLARLSPGETVDLEAKSDARFVILGGEPLPDPTVIYWNFIADTMDEAKQAMLDWESGKFPPVRLYKRIIE